MHRLKSVLFLAAGVLVAGTALAQPRPYIGFAYPAGGQQGTTVQVKLGGQGLDGLTDVLVTGEGVTAKLVEYHRALNNQEASLLREQLGVLKRAGKRGGADRMADSMMSSGDAMMMDGGGHAGASKGKPTDLISRIESRTSEYVNRPASAALAHIAYVEVTLSPDAKPGRHELRLKTLRGISNPLPFYVGQLPEHSRTPLPTAPFQVLGKEQLALRNRPADDVEKTVTLPCTLNGQIASGEVNRYRFKAIKGQKLVLSAVARDLVPFIADAVPGWFQPVLRLKEAGGREVAYSDDHNFSPDPTILFEVPKDGEYLLEVYDAIYRGREDFVYRITAGEVPFVTGVYPLGGNAEKPVTVKLEGWNLDENALPMMQQTQPGICQVTTSRKGMVSNARPFELGTLPELQEKAGNDTQAKAQGIKLPVVVNGRVERRNDWDVFKIAGKSNQVLVAEVRARKLESPLDSVLKITDAEGRLIAFNDDLEDPLAGANTHDADSYLRVTLPSDGPYFVHIGDAAGNFGPDYAYRLRISSAMPDFSLQVLPSSVAMRSKGSASVDVRLVRKDGFAGPVKLSLKDPPPGFSANSVSISGTSTVARITIKTTLASTERPLDLSIVGEAKIQGQNVTREAIATEDRMQAFFWRHLVPAEGFKALVYDPGYSLPPKRVAPELPENQPTLVAENAANKPKFTKQQVAGRLRQLKFLYEEGLLTDQFYFEKVGECEAVRQN